MQENLNYKEAIKAIREFKAVRRAAWPTGLFVALDPNEIPRICNINSADTAYNMSGLLSATMPWSPYNSEIFATDWQVISDESYQNMETE